MALHVDTLEALEVAAHDGRLASAWSGASARRRRPCRSAERLGRQRVRALLQAKAPPIALLLDEEVQPDRRGMAAGLAYGTGPLAFYGAVLQHTQGA